jgi:hypothetical protein
MLSCNLRFRRSVPSGLSKKMRTVKYLGKPPADKVVTWRSESFSLPYTLRILQHADGTVVQETDKDHSWTIPSLVFFQATTLGDTQPLKNIESVQLVGQEKGKNKKHVVNIVANLFIAQKIAHTALQMTRKDAMSCTNPAEYWEKGAFYLNDSPENEEIIQFLLDEGYIEDVDVAESDEGRFSIVRFPDTIQWRRE